MQGRFAIFFVLALSLLASESYSAEYFFVDSTFCPLICDPGEDGREGYVIDILRDALSEHGHTLTFSILPYRRAISMVRNGSADALPAIYHSDAPDLLVGSSVISPGSNQLFMRSDVYRDMGPLVNWSEMSLAVVDGYTFNNRALDEHLEKSRAEGSNQVTFVTGKESYERLVELLFRGRVDAIVDDSAFIYHALNKYLNTVVDAPEVSIVNAAFISSGENVVAYGFVNMDRSLELMSIIDPFVLELYQTGRINDYTSPYGIVMEDGVVMPSD